MGTFQIVTVVVVLAIFGAFAYGAFRAEKVVAVRIQETREAQAKAVAKTAKKKQ